MKGNMTEQETKDLHFYTQLLSDVQVRNNIKTVEDCERIIDQMENKIPHEHLPEHYNWLVARRNRLLKSVRT
jgi:hypothetical protein